MIIAVVVLVVLPISGVKSTVLLTSLTGYHTINGVS